MIFQDLTTRGQSCRAGRQANGSRSTNAIAQRQKAKLTGGMISTTPRARTMLPPPAQRCHGGQKIRSYPVPGPCIFRILSHKQKMSGEHRLWINGQPFPGSPEGPVNKMGIIPPKADYLSIERFMLREGIRLSRQFRQANRMVDGGRQMSAVSVAFESRTVLMAVEPGRASRPCPVQRWVRKFGTGPASSVPARVLSPLVFSYLDFFLEKKDHHFFQ